MRSGRLENIYGTLRYAGIYGYAWTILARIEDTHAYDIDFLDRHIGYADYSYRYNAFPVRCAAENI